MGEKINNSNIAFCYVTGFSFLLAAVTYGIEWRGRRLSIESIEGAIVFGLILFLYHCWFVYDTFVSEQSITVTEAIKYNLKRNAAVWAIYCYWLVFGFAIIVPCF